LSDLKGKRLRKISRISIIQTKTTDLQQTKYDKLRSNNLLTDHLARIISTFGPYAHNHPGERQSPPYVFTDDTETAEREQCSANQPKLAEEEGPYPCGKEIVRTSHQPPRRLFRQQKAQNGLFGTEPGEDFDKSPPRTPHPTAEPGGPSSPTLIKTTSTAKKLCDNFSVAMIHLFLKHLFYQ
jgi:hypothetical protein